MSSASNKGNASGGSRGKDPNAWLLQAPAKHYVLGDVEVAVDSGYVFPDGLPFGKFVCETAESLRRSSGAEIGQCCVRCQRVIEEPEAAEYHGLRGMVLRKLFAVGDSTPVSFGGLNHVYVASAIICVEHLANGLIYSSSLRVSLDLTVPEGPAHVLASELIVRSSLATANSTFSLMSPPSVWDIPVPEVLLVSEASGSDVEVCDGEEVVEVGSTVCVMSEEVCSYSDASVIVDLGEDQCYHSNIEALPPGWIVSIDKSGALSWDRFRPETIAVYPLGWQSLFKGSNRLVAWCGVCERAPFDELGVDSSTMRECLRQVGVAYTEFVYSVGFIRGGFTAAQMDSTLREIRLRAGKSPTVLYKKHWLEYLAESFLLGNVDAIITVQRTFPVAFNPRGFWDVGIYRDRVAGLISGDRGSEFRKQFAFVGGKLLRLVLAVYGFMLRDTSVVNSVTNRHLFEPPLRGLGSSKRGAETARAELMLEYLYSKKGFVRRLDALLGLKEKDPTLLFLLRRMFGTG